MQDIVQKTDDEEQNIVGDDYVSKRYDVYVQERSKELESQLQVSERFEKSLILISGGALGLSMTFIKEIVSAPSFLSWLYWAWGFLAASLCLCVVSLFCSLQSIHRKVINLDEKELRQRIVEGTVQQNESNRQFEKIDINSNPYGTVVEWLNPIAVVCFCVGISALIVFVVKNTSYNLPDTEPHLSDTQVVIPAVTGQDENAVPCPNTDNNQKQTFHPPETLPTGQKDLFRVLFCTRPTSLAPIPFRKSPIPLF